MVNAISRCLIPKPVHNCQFVQLNGAGNSRVTGTHYSHQLFSAFGAAFDAVVQQLPVPLFFDSAETKRALFREQFDTPVRYTGVAVSREFAAAIAGGTLPFIAAALTALTGGTWALSTLMIFMCALSLIGVAGLRDGRELSFVGEGPRLEKEIASPR